MYVIVPQGLEAPVDELKLRVLAVSGTGERRDIATLTDLQAPAGTLDIGRLGDPMPISADGYLAVPFESEWDGTAYGYQRIYDLTSPAAPPVMEIDPPGQTPETGGAPGSWGPDGQIVFDLSDWSDQGVVGRSERLVVDPVTRTRRVVDYADDLHPGRWTADGSGWYAVREAGGEVEAPRLGIVSAATGEFKAVARAVPQAYLAAGGKPVAMDGSVFTSADVDPPPKCSRLVTYPAYQFRGSAASLIWRDSCKDRDPWLDHRFDVDGDGILMMTVDGGELRIIRAAAPGSEQVLAAIPSSRLGASRAAQLQVEVYGMVPGDAPGEVVTAFRASSSNDLFLFSTAAGKLVRVPANAQGYATFGGFAGD